MRRRTDMSGSRLVRICRVCQTQCHGSAAVMGHHLELNGVTRGCCYQDTPTSVPVPTTPDDAGIDAHFNRFAGPDHERRIHPDRRTGAAWQSSARTAGTPSAISWRSGQFKGDEDANSLGRLSGRVNVPSPPDVAVSIGGSHPAWKGLRRGHQSIDRYPHVPDGAPRSALTTRPPNSTVTKKK